MPDNATVDIDADKGRYDDIGKEKLIPLHARADRPAGNRSLTGPG